MPKETFHHLPDEKKEKILKVLKQEFQSKAFPKVNIKTIVEELGIARGSFYQYFEDLEDSYFTILDLETVDIHQLFIKIYCQQDKNLHSALKIYGEAVSEILFQPESYQLYKNRYLYWNEDLNQKWNQRQAKHLHSFRDDLGNNFLEPEKIHFIKSVIHSLIQRNFQLQWSKADFLKKYQLHISWLEKGVN